MPTTRAQANKQNTNDHRANNSSTKTKSVGDKRDVEEVATNKETQQQEPPTKKPKAESPDHSDEHLGAQSGKRLPQTGTIERGHIYFFYRPKVQLEEAHSVDDVKNFHMLLVPRPPEFSTHTKTHGKVDNEEDNDADMKVVSSGADAVPAHATVDESKKKFRLITVGKKQLPDPESGGTGKGRKETFWATVTSIGDNLSRLQEGLGAKSYETKTRGTRHESPARLAARGAYAIVNNDPRVPSGRETHLGYSISHPTKLGDVQESLGIGKAAAFVLQIKNPLAPETAPQQAHSKGAQYPDWIMHDVFGKGGHKGRESYGLRFASCETPELLDYDGAQLLLIAARGGEDGLEASLGEGRGEALEELEEHESRQKIRDVLGELNMSASSIPAEPLQGIWV